MKRNAIILSSLLLMLCSCGKQVSTTQVWLTSAEGAKCDEAEAVCFRKGTVDNAFVIHTDEKRQVIDGYGGSLTESSAFVLACLTPEQRRAVLEELYGEKGADFTVARTQVGASDFSVEGLYSLAEQAGDTALQSFSLARDKEGFSKARYPQVKDEQYDLYHLMKDIAHIKQNQEDKTYRLLASAWTAPAWMKDNGRYYQRDSEARRGGALLPQYYSVYADYLTKYLEAWRAEGVEFWSITPVNEPMGNDGGWESMDFPPAVEAEFIGKYLGPTLAARGFGDVEILGFDQNTFEMGPYTAAIYGDEQANRYTAGMAIHWYGSTISCFPEVLDSIHALYPDKSLFHSEGCIDNLGCPAWDGVTDPVGFMESGWFNNDAFWWTPSATDWAYSTPFWPEWHPRYAAVHRYAQYVIDGVNHWMTGLCDWNIVLDSIGGPNHVGNYAAAPVMIDYANDIVYYTPYYYVLKQFSRSMRPGDVVLRTCPPEGEAHLHLCAVSKADGSIAVNILNRSEHAEEVRLQIGDYCATVPMPANAVKTLFVRL